MPEKDQHRKINMTRTTATTIVTIATYFAVQWEALYIDGKLIVQSDSIEHYHILPALSAIREIGRIEYRRCLAVDEDVTPDLLDDFDGDFPQDIASLLSTSLWVENIVEPEQKSMPSVSGFVLLSGDDDLDEPLGAACQLGDTECESCS